MNVKIWNIEKKIDERGWLAEIINGKTSSCKNLGQVLITTAHPGCVKGNHYHKRKTEWYCVIKGKGNLYLQNLHTGEQVNHIMEEENMKLVVIPPFYYHRIENIGDDEMYLLAYVSEPFNPSDPDTFTIQENMI